MSTGPFIILSLFLAFIVWLLGGVGAGTSGRGPGVTDKCDECGQKKKPSKWGGPR